MRSSIGLSLAFIALLAAISAPDQVSVSIHSGAPDKAIVGLPYAADQTVTTVRHLANGLAVNREMKGHIYRSASGLERYDGDMPSTDPAHPEPTTMAFILNREKHTSILLNYTLKTAVTGTLPAEATILVSLLPLPQNPAQDRMIDPASRDSVDLGHRMQDQIDIHGRRITATIPAGKVGNEQPLLVSTEVWVAPDQKITVKQIDRSPLSGERTFELTNIRIVEPDPALFEIPEGYTVKERPALPPNPLSNLTPTHPSTSPGFAPPQLIQPATPEQTTPQIQAALDDPSPNVKNSVAYALANNNDHLADAQVLAEQAVQVQEQQSADIVAAGDSTKIFHQMSVLSSFWDTLGWVYYREGEQEKAEAFLLAAWGLKPNPEYAMHLGRIYEAQLRPKDAIGFYRMALSGKNSPAAQDFFQTRLAKLGDASAQPLPIEAITPLPSLDAPAQPGPSVALVDILLTHDAPPSVSFVEGDPKIGPAVIEAIQAALAKDLPDSGPEKILRRAQLTCIADANPVCTLHFLSSDKIAARPMPSPNK